jgi:cation transport regulator ChaC
MSWKEHNRDRLVYVMERDGANITEDQKEKLLKYITEIRIVKNHVTYLSKRPQKQWIDKLLRNHSKAIINRFEYVTREKVK